MSAPQDGALSEVSVVILTCDRQDFVRRQLLYLSEFAVPVIVADGSEKAWEHGECGSLGLATWEYFQLPGLSSYSRRLVEPVNRVKPEFITFADDQDGHLGTEIRQAVQTLTADVTGVFHGSWTSSLLTRGWVCGPKSKEVLTAVQG